MKNRRNRPYDPLLFKGIAHRGLHDAESTENGMGAFRKAVEAGVAIECDVHLSKDHHLIICHDFDLERTTGKKGIIEELTLQEIKEGYRLLDGGEVPTFQELYDMVQERVPLVVELKTKAKNNLAVAKQARKEFRQVKDPSKLAVIAFDPRALVCMRSTPFALGLLVCTNALWVFGLTGCFDFLDVQDCLVEDPRVLKWKKKGYLVNVWTIDTEEKLAKVAPHADMITFQDLPVSTIREAISR